MSNHNSKLKKEGFSILNPMFNQKEIDLVNDVISSSFIDKQPVYAIRQLFRCLPELKSIILKSDLIELIQSIGGNDYFLTKAIYFNKPKSSNWFVAYHQDLSISVNQKHEIDGYSQWTFKKGQHGVIPPIKVLESIITVRIHLDDTNNKNGALKVIPKSHLNGIIRPESLDNEIQTETICNVKKGGIMLMTPLLLHASDRTINDNQRRVIHLEFSNQELAKPIQWLERIKLSTK